jgi:hypothetical protein
VFSPNGRWVAYAARESDVNRIYVQPFPSTGEKYVLPRSGGAPYWSPKGDELIHNVSPTHSVTVAFTGTPRVIFGQPKEFLRTGYFEGNPIITRRNVDPLPDGEYIIGVMNRTASGRQQATELLSQINVVLNWFDEVRQRMAKQ